MSLLNYICISNKTLSTFVFDGIPFPPAMPIEIEDDLQILQLIKDDAFKSAIEGGSLDIKNSANQILSISDAIEQLFGSDNTGDTHMERASENGVQTTQNAAWNNQVTLITSNLKAGLYEVKWYTDKTYDTTSNDLMVRLRWNNVKTIASNRVEQKESGGGNWQNTGNNQSHFWTGWLDLNLEGTNTFVLEYKGERSQDEASLWNSRIKLTYQGPTRPVAETDFDAIEGPI